MIFPPLTGQYKKLKDKIKKHMKLDINNEGTHNQWQNIKNSIYIEKMLEYRKKKARKK